MALACRSGSSPVNRAGGGPGSAASSLAESIVKPAGDKTPCIDCGDFECCCIPIPCTVM
ncbi:hypothetical protein ACCO45_004396 [Purpureocillium lilacinum]|uniref:Uncharacterized protein n=1 Tax=Purpureocillium lilacinum TaxID=33203 RepID=A0ACC4E5S4_PURLI